MVIFSEFPGHPAQAGPPGLQPSPLDCPRQALRACSPWSPGVNGLLKYKSPYWANPCDHCHLVYRYYSQLHTNDFLITTFSCLNIIQLSDLHIWVTTPML